MPARTFRPDRLAVAAFAEAGQSLEGDLPQERFPRLVEALLPGADGQRRPVRWSARGERRQPRIGPPETWLLLSAATAGRMTCQRCLEPLEVELLVEDRPFRFVESEAVAAELDETVEEDVLVLSTAFDLYHLIEDELLLTLPWVPRHAHCDGVPGARMPVRREGEAADGNAGGMPAVPPAGTPLTAAASGGAEDAGDVETGRRPSPFAGLARLKGLRAAPDGRAADAPAVPPAPPATGDVASKRRRR